MSGADTPCEQCGCDVDELTALLSEQRELYKQLAGLAEHQRSLIAGDDAERLLGILGTRQKIIDRLETLADRMRPYQQNWQAIRDRMPDLQGRRVDQLVAEVNTLLSTILAKDKADADTLAARKTATATAMTQLKTSKAAGAAYAAVAGVRESHVNWTDE